MIRKPFLKFTLVAMATSLLALTSCTKDVEYYLIGQWNEMQVTTTCLGETTTKKLNGNYIFEADGALSHTYKQGSKYVTDYGTWQFFDNAGSLWLTFNEETNVMHLDQIDDHTMQWTDYEKNRVGETVVYVYKLHK